MPLSDAERALRMRGIGSSEIAAVCGVSFWGKGPLSVYVVKRGLVDEHGETLDTRIGHKMETGIAELYTEETGEALRTCTTRVHPEHSWILATVDRERVSDGCPVEIKHVSGLRAHYFEGGNRCDVCGRVESLHWGRESDDVPDDVRCQVEWQMLVTGAQRAYVARVWFGSFAREFKIYSVDASEVLQSKLLETGRRFWFEHVLAGNPPPPDASESARDALTACYPSVLEPIRDALPDIDPWIEQWRTAKETKARAAAAEQEAGNWIRASIGAAEGVRGHFGIITNRARVDGVRVLRAQWSKT